MRKRTLLWMMLMGIAGVVCAQNKYIPSSIIEVNNVRGNILGTGNVYSNMLGNSLTWEVPKDSGKSTLFQYSMWIGGVDQDSQLHLAANKFNQQGRDYWMGPLRLDDATIDAEVEQQFEHIWNLTRLQIDEFISNHGKPGYEIPEDILTWPAHGPEGYAANLAPFEDVNGDGHYNPEDGDYPKFLGDQCLFFIFNDSYEAHTESGGEKLGLEVHAMVYAYNTPDDENLNNTVFFHYEMFNRSQNDYNGTYVGLWNDWDIGSAWDDYIGCDVQHSACYGYNAYPIDGNGEPQAYGDNPPVQLCTILAGPYMDVDGFDNLGYSGECESSDNYYSVNFGNGIVDDERLGMSGFLYHNNGYGTNGNYDPTEDFHYYNYLRGIWQNGVPMSYGGDAFTTGVVGPQCKYMFPGDSDPCNYGTDGILPNGGFNVDGYYWTEEAVGNMPSDRRGLASVGPFTFISNTMQPLDFAMTTVWKTENQTALEGVESSINEVMGRFATDYGLAVAEHPVNKESLLKVYPNPSEGAVTIEGTGRLMVMNLLGQQVLTRDVDGQTTLTLPSGLYFVRLEGEKGVSVNKLVVK